MRLPLHSQTLLTSSGTKILFSIIEQPSYLPETRPPQSEPVSNILQSCIDQCPEPSEIPLGHVAAQQGNLVLVSYLFVVE